MARMCYTWTREDYSNGYTTRRSSSCFVDGKLEGRVKTTCYRDEGSLDLFLFFYWKDKLSVKYINCERDGEVISEIINLTFIRKGGLAKAENTSLFFSKKPRRSFVHRVT